MAQCLMKENLTCGRPRRIPPQVLATSMSLVLYPPPQHMEHENWPFVDYRTVLEREATEGSGIVRGRVD